MTPNQISLLRKTWVAVIPNGDAVAQLFYAKLFETDPSAAALFAGKDMPRQHTLLLQALGRVIEKADQAEELVPTLEALGRRHVNYGVEDRHYASVGTALIATLEQGLGPAFTEDVRAAWVTAYSLISDTMRRAAAETCEAAGSRRLRSRSMSRRGVAAASRCGTKYISHL